MHKHIRPTFILFEKRLLSVASANICKDDGAIDGNSPTAGAMHIRSHDSIVSPMLRHRRGMRVSFYPFAYCSLSIVYNLDATVISNMTV